jgi:uncharacterized membrane protein YbjE (DUF340 family)
MNLLALLLVLTLGALAGFGLRRHSRAIALNRAATRYAIAALLFFMGTRLAAARHLFAQDLGALLAALGSSVLLVAVYFLVFFLFGKAWHRFQGGPGPAEPEAAGAPAGHELAGVAWNAGWILAGFLVYAALPLRLTGALPVAAAADWILRFLLVVIGFDLGAEFHRLEFRSLPWPLLLVPVVNVALTLGCALLFSAMRGLPPRQSLLLYSGLGWYSLSSVLIAQKGLALLGLLAFIHNVFRELLAILTAPLAARVSPYLPIYLGGATAMDVMLPFVQRHSGRTYTLVSFYSGMACSLAVIPLVRIFLGA